VCVMVLVHLLILAGVLKQSVTDCRGHTGIPSGVVTSLLCVFGTCASASDCGNKKTKINLPKQRIPWLYMDHLFVLFILGYFSVS